MGRLTELGGDQKGGGEGGGGEDELERWHGWLDGRGIYPTLLLCCGTWTFALEKISPGALDL